MLSNAGALAVGETYPFILDYGLEGIGGLHSGCFKNSVLHRAMRRSVPEEADALLVSRKRSDSVNNDYSSGSCCGVNIERSSKGH